MPLSNKQDLPWQEGKKLVPLDAFPAAKVTQKGVKEKQSFCMSGTASGAWLGAGEQRTGEGDSSTVLLYCHVC